VQQATCVEQGALIAEHCSTHAASPEQVTWAQKHGVPACAVPQALMSSVRSYPTHESPGQQSPCVAQTASTSTQKGFGVTHTPPVHSSLALQHPSVRQDCPVAEQVGPPPPPPPLPTHVPLVFPSSMLQVRPVQQSSFRVQVPVSGTHGARQSPPSHTPEQQSAAPLQALPIVRQSVHPAPVQPGGAQAKPTSGRFWQVVPSQHGSAPAASQPRVPKGRQVLTFAQRRTPAASGTQGVPPQHWSRNWHTAPSGLQQ
jgi:hypothetical protein